MTPPGTILTAVTASPPVRALPQATPTVRRGSRNTYVLILQDGLNALGYSTRTLDGIFGANTENALKGFQRAVGLTADGICGCQSWKTTAAVVGIGRTRTVID